MRIFRHIYIFALWQRIVELEAVFVAVRLYGKMQVAVLQSASGIPTCKAIDGLLGVKGVNDGLCRFGSPYERKP